MHIQAFKNRRGFRESPSTFVESSPKIRLFDSNIYFDEEISTAVNFAVNRKTRCEKRVLVDLCLDFRGIVDLASGLFISSVSDSRVRVRG